MDMYSGKVAVIEARGQWEYLYSRQELATLSGNRFHKKKNHVNGFYKSYACEYHPLTTEDGVKGSLEDVLELQNEWCKWHDCENSNSLYAENEAIFRVIGSWSAFGSLFGGSFYIDDKWSLLPLGKSLMIKRALCILKRLIPITAEFIRPSIMPLSITARKALKLSTGNRIWTKRVSVKQSLRITP